MKSIFKTPLALYNKILFDSFSIKKKNIVFYYYLIYIVSYLHHLFQGGGGELLRLTLP